MSRHLEDCDALWTGAPDDCRCAARLQDLHDLEMERRIAHNRELDDQIEEAQR